MMFAFIILLIIALGLGGYIAFVIIKDKKKVPKEQIVNPASKNEDQVEETLHLPQEELALEPAPESKSLDSDQEETTELKAVEENGETRYIIIKYSKSFLAKLIQSDDETKRYYSQIKNWLLGYEGVKCRISWKWETFRFGKNILAKLRIRGKTLSLCLALNADDYFETKYLVENLIEVKSFVDTPCMYRIKNDRRLRYSAELISQLMQKNDINRKQEAQDIDYVLQYSYEDNEALIERKLIKVLTDDEAQSGTSFKPSEIRKSVTVLEADNLMEDEMAVNLIEKSEAISDKTKTGIINIDTLSEYFSSGEIVTLEEIKNRVKGFSKQITYLKVLARGTLSKSLTIEADSFSLQAVKMILLTGGRVIKK